MSTCLGTSANLLHGRSDQIFNGAVCQLNPTGVEIRDGTDGVQAGIVQQLPPATEADVGVKLRIALATCPIDLTVFFGGCVLFVGIQVWIAEGSHVEFVIVFVDDLSYGDLMGATEADAREDDIFWEGRNEGLFYVQAILDESDACVAPGDGGADDLCYGRGHIGVVLGGDDDVTVRGEIFFLNVWDGISYCQGDCQWESADVKVGCIRIDGRKPFTSP